MSGGIIGDAPGEPYKSMGTLGYADRESYRLSVDPGARSIPAGEAAIVSVEVFHLEASPSRACRPRHGRAGQPTSLSQHGRPRPTMEGTRAVLSCRHALCSCMHAAGWSVEVEWEVEGIG